MRLPRGDTRSGPSDVTCVAKIATRFLQIAGALSGLSSRRWTSTKEASITATTFPSFAPPSREAGSAVGNAPIESLTLRAEGIGDHDVLRAFDMLRRRLSWRLRGTEGCFAGYTRLELRSGLLASQARLTCIAVVVSATAERLDVRFEALLEPEDSPLDEPSNRAVRIVLADGHVVAFG